MPLAHQGSECLVHPVNTLGIAFHARWLGAPLHRVEAHCLVQNQGTLLTMVSPLFPPLSRYCWRSWRYAGCHSWREHAPSVTLYDPSVPHA